MARPRKIGLDYFPLDCQLDDKVDMLESEHGNDGFCAWIKLMQYIYMTENGELDISDILRRKTYAKRANISVETWNNCLETMVNIGLFDKKRYESDHILTSNGIQKRIDEVYKVRKNGRERANKGSSPKNERITPESKSKIESKSKDYKEIHKEKKFETEIVSDPAWQEVLKTTFEWFWKIYDKNISRDTCWFHFQKLNVFELDKIKKHVPEYVTHTEKQFRKNPLNYITDKAYNDEIIKIKNHENNERSDRNGHSKAGRYSTGIDNGSKI